MDEFYTPCIKVKRILYVCILHPADYTDRSVGPAWGLAYSVYSKHSQPSRHVVKYYITRTHGRSGCRRKLILP